MYHCNSIGGPYTLLVPFILLCVCSPPSPETLGDHPQVAMTNECGSPATFFTAQDGSSEIWHDRTHAADSVPLSELSRVSTVRAVSAEEGSVNEATPERTRLLLADDDDNEPPSNSVHTTYDVDVLGSTDHSLQNHTNPNPNYAQKDMLKQYIPGLDPSKKTFKMRMSKRGSMLRINFILSTVIVGINLGTLLWALLAHPPDDRGVGTLRIGDCDETTKLNTVLHLCLNVLSSLFLGAGNYCMQTLVAPSRVEMDRAHAKGKSLDIGVPSIRNLKHIARVRAYLWASLGVLSTCLHLL